MKYNFTPRPDITAYELALLWQKFNLVVDEEVYNKLPLDMRGNFTKQDPSKRDGEK